MARTRMALPRNRGEVELTKASIARATMVALTTEIAAIQPTSAMVGGLGGAAGVSAGWSEEGSGEADGVTALLSSRHRRCADRRRHEVRRRHRIQLRWCIGATGPFAAVSLGPPG